MCKAGLSGLAKNRNQKVFKYEYLFIHMVRTNTTISIDSDIRKEGKALLSKKGINLSYFIETCLKNYIAKNKKEGKDNGKKRV